MPLPVFADTYIALGIFLQDAKSDLFTTKISFSVADEILASFVPSITRKTKFAFSISDLVR